MDTTPTSPKAPKKILSTSRLRSITSPANAFLSRFSMEEDRSNVTKSPSAPLNTFPPNKQNASTNENGPSSVPSSPANSRRFIGSDAIAPLSAFLSKRNTFDESIAFLFPSRRTESNEPRPQNLSPTNSSVSTEPTSPVSESCSENSLVNETPPPIPSREIKPPVISKPSNSKNRKRKDSEFSPEMAAICIQKKYRMWKTRKNYLTKKQQVQRRRNIISELIETEKTYVHNLELVTVHYLRPLREIQLMSLEQIQVVFSEIAVIFSCHKQLLSKMEILFTNWEPIRSLFIHVLFDITDYMEVYYRYVSNFNQAIDYYRKMLRESKELMDFFTETKMKTGNLSLEDLLITPVQRLPRYELLLENLALNTWNYHPDYENLTRSKEIISQICSAFRSSAFKNYDKKTLKLLKKKSKHKKGLNLSLHKDPFLWEMLATILKGHLLTEEREEYLISLFEENVDLLPPKTDVIRMMNVIEKLYQQFMFKHKQDEAIIKVQSLVRRWLAQRQFRTMIAKAGPNWFTRNEQLKEFLNTEKKYVSKLDKLIQNFLFPLREMGKKRTVIVTPGDLASIFGNIEVLFVSHKNFLQDFEILFANWPNQDNLGQIIVKASPYFEPYNEYLKNFKNSLDTINRCCNDPKFASLIQKLEASLNDLDFRSLLSSPVNRLSQFQFYIQRLIELMPLDHPDHENLASSFSILSNLVERIQDGLEFAENETKMQNVRRRIVTAQREGSYSLAAYGNFDVDITGGKRLFVKEGYVHFSFPNKHKKRRYLFLFSDLLIITKEFSKQQFKIKKMLVLDGKMELVYPSQDESNHHFTPHFSQHSFYGSCIFNLNSECFTFYWKTEQEKQDWEPHLRDIIHKCREGHRILGVSLKAQLKKDSNNNSSNKLETEKVPRCIQTLTNHILNRDTSHQFVGEIAVASPIQEKQLWIRFEQEILDLSKLSLPTLSRLLKNYLNSLPEPLFGTHLYKKWLQFGEIENNSQKILFIVEQFKLLEPEALATIQYLFQFFISLATHPSNTSVTNRNIRQIASIYGPALIRSTSEDQLNQTLQIPVINRIVEFILNNHQSIFLVKK